MLKKHIPSTMNSEFAPGVATVSCGKSNARQRSTFRLLHDLCIINIRSILIAACHVDNFITLFCPNHETITYLLIEPEQGDINLPISTQGY